MTHLIIFGLVSISLNNLLTKEQIFQWLRNIIDRYPDNILYKIFYCMPCSAFWYGCGLFWLLQLNYNPLVNIILAGCISSICAKIYALLFNKI